MDEENLAVQLNMLQTLDAFTESELDPEFVSNVVQAELVAHVAWTDFSRRHKGKSKGRSKGNGFGKSHAPKGNSKGKFGIRKGNSKGSAKLSLEDRKARLKKLKRDTRCHDCGQSGHWSGDPECPKGKSVQPHAHIAIINEEYEDGEYEDTTATSSLQPTALMVTQSEDESWSEASDQDKGSWIIVGGQGEPEDGDYYDGSFSVEDRTGYAFVANSNAAPSGSATTPMPKAYPREGELQRFSDGPYKNETYHSVAFAAQGTERFNWMRSTTRETRTVTSLPEEVH